VCVCVWVWVCVTCVCVCACGCVRVGGGVCARVCVLCVPNAGVFSVRMALPIATYAWHQWQCRPFPLHAARLNLHFARVQSSVERWQVEHGPPLHSGMGMDLTVEQRAWAQQRNNNAQHNDNVWSNTTEPILLACTPKHTDKTKLITLCHVILLHRAVIAP